MSAVKKILFMAAALLAGVSAARAESDASLSKILSANAGVKTIEAQFSETKSLAASGKVINSTGTLYYTAADKMSMMYAAPSKDNLVINGNSFYLKRGGRAATYDISTNALMGSLAKTLLGCVHGEVEKVAQSNNATVETKETSEGHVVTLTARKVAARGYSKIVLTYRKSDSMLVRMQMDQAGGISTVYVMSDIKTGVDIDPSEFNIPSKQQ